MTDEELLKPSHPYRIDYPDESHTRFRSYLCGARSVVATRLPMVHESTGERAGFHECYKAVVEADAQFSALVDRS
jgi:hypothetical protein